MGISADQIGRLTRPDPIRVEVDNSGNECRVNIGATGPFYLPCHKLSPHVYPRLWVHYGMDV